MLDTCCHMFPVSQAEWEKRTVPAPEFQFVPISGTGQMIGLVKGKALNTPRSARTNTVENRTRNFEIRLVNYRFTYIIRRS